MSSSSSSSLSGTQEQEQATNVISGWERWVLKRLGLVHGVTGRIEHPTVAEELLTFARGRTTRARARGPSLKSPRLRVRRKGEPLSPSFNIYRAMSWGRKAKEKGKKEVQFMSTQAVDQAIKDNTDDDDSTVGDGEEFKDIAGGHKKFNRLWLQSKNPMASAGRFILEGDESRFSMGLIEECWYLLVNVVSWKRLLLINAFVEITVIVLFATVLTAIAAIDGSCTPCAISGSLFRRKFLLCLTTVRLSSDSVFGWEESAPSTDYEVLFLTLEGWIHWLLLNLFSAIIVTRAMRPQRGLVYSPDCVINSKELAIRLHNLRWKHVTLYNVRAYLHCTTKEGEHVAMSFNNDHYPVWGAVGMPITLKHNVTDPSSPLFEGGHKNIMNIVVFVECEDQNGQRLCCGEIYHDPTGLRASKLISAGYHVPRFFVNAKFKDQIRMFRDRQGNSCLEPPHLAIDMDSFTRICRVEQEEVVKKKKGLF